MYDFSDFEYGERIIRTIDGQDFALLTIEDPVVKELGRLLDDIYHGELDELKRAKLFNRVFAFTCDPLNGRANVLIGWPPSKGRMASLNGEVDSSR